MKIVILGSGSNGGVPEWDCPCNNCQRARSQKEFSRTRSSLALTLDDERYILIDASPDLKLQLEEGGLGPRDLRRGDLYERNTRIESILLTHGHGDHCVGLFELSTAKCFNIPVYGPPDLIRYLFGTPEEVRFFRDLGRLAPDYVKPLVLEESRGISLLGGEMKVEGFEIPHTSLVDGAYFPSRTYGYEVSSDGMRLVYTPDLGDLSEKVLTRVDGADLFILDGSFWWDDELERVSGLRKTSHELGHVPMEESLEALREVDVGRVVYTHINHTNPILEPKRPMRDRLVESGFEVAHDGQVIIL